MKRIYPLTKMARAALAELSLAEPRSLGCGERLRHLRKAIKIDERLRDYFFKYGKRHQKFTSVDSRLVGKLNRAVPAVRRVVYAACVRGGRKHRRARLARMESGG